VAGAPFTSALLVLVLVSDPLQASRCLHPALLSASCLNCPNILHPRAFESESLHVDPGGGEREPIALARENRSSPRITRIFLVQTSWTGRGTPGSESIQA